MGVEKIDIGIICSKYSIHAFELMRFYRKNNVLFEGFAVSESALFEYDLRALMKKPLSKNLYRHDALTYQISYYNAQLEKEKDLDEITKLNSARDSCQREQLGLKSKIEQIMKG